MQNEEVMGKCSLCNAEIEEGVIGWCRECYKKKYGTEPSKEGANY